MPSLKNIFKKYTGRLRSIKGVYVLNNLLNSNKLNRNKELYEKYGLNKSVYANIGSKDFKEHHSDIPWLDKADGREKLEAHPYYNDLPKTMKTQLLNFIDNGFMVLKGFYSVDEVSTLNQEVDRLLAENETDFTFSRRIMDAHEISETVNKYFRHQRIIELLDFVMGKKVIPFQTINFIEGSEQKAHSDFIHMTTEPQGYLVATWTALEKTHKNNGPLFYYPKSHRLPYVTCEHYDSGNTALFIGENSYKQYEAKIESVLAENGFEKTYFHADAGDVFIWHANLLHGGSPILEKGLTRKSMVCHYFCENVICYHELSQRPALIS